MAPRRNIYRNIFTSKTLDLQGSVARDHLANERTFLAWIRTGFATAALGVVIARMQMIGTVKESGVDPVFFKILSLVYILVGALCVVNGSHRYAKVEDCMKNGQYPTSGLSGSLVAISGLFAFLATFVVILI